MNNNHLILLRNREWLKKRRLVLKRDNHKCRICGNRKNLNIHHRQYHTDNRRGKFLKPWQYKLKYLVTLCRDCHIAGHLKHKIKIT